ncbi:unnamed protein product [Soboliphyme baturini]|uniref:MFS domain-containing protein n=1 Tax=Soboliphyme baturini TaxID=241478 RepID=A0A183IER1_9BILA|nr:unnamed protein product [Soboliphyme baturini]
MFSYAVGLFLSGMIGDRVEPRILLSVGMLLTGIVGCILILYSTCTPTSRFSASDMKLRAILLTAMQSNNIFQNILFGCVTEWWEFYSKPFYVCLWLLNGLAQSTGWPAEVCIMGNWFGKASRGFIFGIWSSCASVGNIIGAELASAILPFGYEYTFLANSSLLVAGAIIVFFGAVSSPEDLGLTATAANDRSNSNSQKSLVAQSSTEEINDMEDVDDDAKPISLFQAIMLPGVIAYSLAYTCLKLVNYSIFFWLPFYLTNNFGWQEELSDTISTFYDWGGIIGGVLAGVLSVGRSVSVTSSLYNA